MKTSRLRQIDLLRGIAIFLVLFQHAPMSPDTWPPLCQAVFKPLVQLGWTGVDLFFVLSGFLVSGLIFGEYRQKSSFDPKRFLIRRGFKIYPAYYILILATLLIRNTVSKVGVPADSLISQILFLQNYGPRIWNHTWSLAVEEHFYIALCFMMFALSRKGTADPFKPVPWICFAAGAAAMFFRYLLGPTDSIPKFFFPTHLRMDSLFFGVLLSYFYQFHSEKLKKFMSGGFHGVLFIILFAATIFCVRGSNYISQRVFGYTLLYLSFGYLLLIFLYKPVYSFGVLGRFVSYVGVYSYSIYLWHMPLDHWFGRAVGSLTHPYQSPIYFALTLTGGIVLGKLIEMPALKLRDKIEPSGGRIFPSSAAGG